MQNVYCEKRTSILVLLLVSFNLNGTFSLGLLVQIGEEVLSHRFISSKSECVGQQGGHVSVVDVMGRFLQTCKAFSHHGILTKHTETDECFLPSLITFSIDLDLNLSD